MPFAAADESISYDADSLLYALLWRAKKVTKVKDLENKHANPLVILIHGGCWLRAYDIQHTFALSTGLAQAGFNVWSLEYRRSGDIGAVGQPLVMM
ncbi:MAG: acetyl esterase/lipase [Gammaproteobacteria bacterium]